MKKILLYIFICISAIFLMSHNTYAEVLSIGVSPKWTNWGATWQFHYLYDSNGNPSWASGSSNTVTASLTTSIRQVRFNLPNGITLESGDYIVAEMVYNLETQNNSNDMIFGAMKSQTSGIGLIDVSVNRGSNAMGSIKFTFKVEQTIRVTNTTTYVTIGTSRGAVSQYNIFWFNEASGYIQGGVVNFYSTKSSTDYSGGINDLKNGVTNLNNKLNDANSKLEDIAENQEERAQKEDEAIGNIEDQSPSDIGNTTDNKTSSLLGVFGSFVTAIGSINPSNCNVDFDTGYIDFGTQNLCSQNVPTAFTVVTSIIVLCFTIPFVVHVIRRILALIREMQT